jgi:hypothetical protein
MILSRGQKDMIYSGVEIYFQQKNDRPDEDNGQVGNSYLSGARLDQDEYLIK